MRTTLEIDDELMSALMAHYPGATKRDAVQAAIRELVQRDAIETLMAMAGTVDIEDVSADLRKVDRHT